MKNKKILYAVIAAANALSVAGMIILTAAGSSLAKSQSYNYAAQKWDSDNGCSQISCFFAEDAGVSTDNIGGAETAMLTALKNISIVPEENQKLIPEAYSASAGQSVIRSDTTNGRSNAELIAVGGDFFLFHDFSLLDGSYFSDSDIMQDGAVIDRNLAWSLYGSDNISGKNIYIDGVKFYISGVVDIPQTKYEQKTTGEFPVAYITYDGANLLNKVSDFGSDSYNADFNKITCYECIMPDPVENYAYNTIDGYFKSYEGKYAIVSNSERFKPSVRAKAHKNLADYAIVSNSVIYPAWENASRIVEFKLTSVYFYRRLTYIIPVLTVLYLLVILWKMAGNAKRKAIDWTGNKITHIIYNHKNKNEKGNL